jgi:hypothetical protein
MTITGTVGPPTWVDGPFPVVRKSRLLDVATIKPDDDPHWRSSAQVWTYPPDGAFTWNPCPEGTFAEGTKFEGGAIPIPLFNAFQVYVAETCLAKSVNVDRIEEYTARAVAVFAAVESHGVEHVLSQGLFGSANPYLADSEVDLIAAGAAQTLAESLALLEDAIAATQRGGVIHATAGTVTGWESLGFTLDRVAGVLVTRACQTPIVVGTGYAGAQPAGGAAPGTHTAWAFATGPVDIRRGDVEVLPPQIKQTLDRTTNEVTYRAERDYLVDWDTVLQAAVLVDRTL